ncbi:uncharacterized protein LOC110455013 [Mizuhopecten yessoensis]|uniref:TIR domain-containing protein n=1 Tax=Mizuhopecten yessoensis TaxID=6573 RepID=A0A210QDV9_MIZYE|nr:uncharacterized protein LOC110455013 [Mizuhopecten yessoensis]XP_021360566.1 uncharacterized protein LOC110455013 [Mizuhopecten yessoensis]OWF46944.1 hypothetical protein KP79_PYT14922 [Mizuhopecten yessoensis]
MTSNGTVTNMGQGATSCQRSNDQRLHMGQRSDDQGVHADNDQKLDDSMSQTGMSLEDLAIGMHAGQRSDESRSNPCPRSEDPELQSSQRSENLRSHSDQSSVSERGQEEVLAESSISLLEEETINDSGVGDIEQSIQLCNTSSLSPIVSCELPPLGMPDELSALVSSIESETSQSSSATESISVSSLSNVTIESVKCLKDRDIDITDPKLLKHIDLLLCDLKQSADNPLKKIQVMDEIIHAEFIVVCERLFKYLVDTDITLVVPGSSWSHLKKLLSLIWILSDGSITLCEQLVQSHCALTMIADLLKRLSEPCDLEKNTVSKYLVKALLGVLHNVSRHLCDTNVRGTLRQAGVMTNLKTLSLSRTPMVQAKALLVMSYILDESEIVILSVDDNILQFIVQVLNDAYQSKTHFSSKFGMNVEETLRGLNNLAINDKNKVCILKFGVLRIYVNLILEYTNPDEVFQAISGIWRLAFHKGNCHSIRSHPQCIEALMSLQKSNDEAIRHAARGALWELREVPELQLRPDLASLVVQCPHVMISYQWGSQPLALRLIDVLKHAGYKVWMDVEHMTGSTLEAMALAVERSAVVLICMSQRYKDSPSCRSEAEYTYKLRKSFIPVCVQEKYEADGWLGMLIGTRLYFDISTEPLFDRQMPNLIKELGDRGRLSARTEIVDDEVTTPGYVARLTSNWSTKHSHANWTIQNVSDWMKNLSLTEVPQELLHLDGTMLWESKKMLETSPDFLYTYLHSDLKMTFPDILKLSRALRQL